MNKRAKIALGESIVRKLTRGEIRSALSCMKKHSSTVSYELAKMGIGTLHTCPNCPAVKNSRPAARRRRK